MLHLLEDEYVYSGGGNGGRFPRSNLMGLRKAQLEDQAKEESFDANERTIGTKRTCT